MLRLTKQTQMSRSDLCNGLYFYSRVGIFFFNKTLFQKWCFIINLNRPIFAFKRVLNYLSFKYFQQRV